MMVNRLGLTVKGLEAYHMSQKSPIPDAEHNGAKDMKQPQDWRLCELDKVREILHELLKEVKLENQGNDALEAKYEAANKGFIKRWFLIRPFGTDI
jgi:nucleoporin NUP159